MSWKFSVHSRRGVVLTPMAIVAGIVGVTAGIGADPAYASPAVIAGTPCTVGARACVDLISQRAWLIDPAGKITRGPVAVATGGLGQETPIGTFKVLWKNKDHKSKEFKTPQGLPAPMPWSVFFAEGGIAFHAGTLERSSAGCVRLQNAEAQTFYNTLQVGDEVQVRSGSGAAASPPAPTNQPTTAAPRPAPKPNPPAAEDQAPPAPAGGQGEPRSSQPSDRPDASPNNEHAPNNEQPNGNPGEPTRPRLGDAIPRGL